MAIIVGADCNGQHLKNIIVTYLKENNVDVIDVTQENSDFIDATLNVVKAVKEDECHLGIVIDAFGAGSFMVASKIKGIVAAQVSDERSAYMTRSHNNSKIITMGSEIVGNQLAKNIVKQFISGSYDGGRHQIRVDMLNKMGK